MLTDNQLIHKIKRKQNRQAADELIERYYKEIYAYTYRQVTDVELSMDLTQDIFIAVLKGISTFDERKAQFRTWLYRVASNKITDYYRSYQHKMRLLEETFSPELEENLNSPDTDLLEHILQKEKMRKVMEVVTQYDIRWVRIFQMKCFEEKTFAEIAEALGLSDNTVKTRFYNMLRRIQTEVADYE